MSSGSSSPGSRSMSPQPVRHEVLLGASVPHSPFHSPYHPSPIPFPDIHEMATLGSGGRNNPHNFSSHFPIHRIPRNSPRPNNKHHNAPDWQTTRCKVAERGKHLLDSGIWSDCEFIVGLPPNIKIFHCHKMFLAMASPVFEAMFYGGLAETKREIKILDVQPEAFGAMLSYIYTDEVHLTSFELVCDICYAAKKYMLPDLVEECTKYLWRDLYPRNACRALEFAKLFEEPVLLEKALQIITHQTLDVIEENTWLDIERATLVIILSKDSLAAPESLMFDAMDRWAAKECERRGMNITGDTKRIVLGDAVHLIRYLALSAAEFAAGPAQSGILLQQESFSILMNISCPGSWELPDHMAKIAEARRDPGRVVEVLQNCGSKHWCKRAMMQEPHCLNTSILDCSVTFTVDKDVWIHGIEVPSQVTDVPEQLMLESLQPPVEGLPIICHSTHGYSELLYAHLLDGDGQRLTYTHFTAKVNWNSMIEITFNRSVKINANKVYRIGMVLNKVGWYPMGVCTRRVNCEGSFFTFCVGQPNDTLRDGLIRSIIFSRIDSLWSGS